jgi:hypothetical protein
MKKYGLYREWREVNRIGADLSDALLRGKTLMRTDTFADGRKVADGEVLTIAKIHKTGPAPYSRGNDSVERAIVEFTDGQILEIDAKLRETIE